MTWFWQRRWRTKIILSVVSLLIIVTLVQSVGGSGSPKPHTARVADATVTVAGTSQVANTGTREPTRVSTVAPTPSPTIAPSPTPSPTIAPTPTPSPAPKLTITSPKNGMTTTTKDITVEGQAAPNAKIWLEIPDWPDASFHADEKGNWHYQPKIIKSGAQTFTFHLDTDNAIKASITVTYAPPAPTPTPTPSKPSLTPAQQHYVAELQSESTALQASLNRFSQLSINAGNDPTLLFDSSWQNNVAKELGLWVGTYNADKDRTAPPGLEIINGKWIEMMGHLNLVANDYAKGIDDAINGDTNDGIALINQATTELTTADQNIAELTPLLNQFISKHGG